MILILTKWYTLLVKNVHVQWFSHLKCQTYSLKGLKCIIISGHSIFLSYKKQLYLFNFGVCVVLFVVLCPLFLNLNFLLKRKLSANNKGGKYEQKTHVQQSPDHSVSLPKFKHRKHQSNRQEYRGIIKTNSTQCTALTTSYHSHSRAHTSPPRHPFRQKQNKVLVISTRNS